MVLEIHLHIDALQQFHNDEESILAEREVRVDDLNSMFTRESLKNLCLSNQSPLLRLRKRSSFVGQNNFESHSSANNSLFRLEDTPKRPLS